MPAVFLSEFAGAGSQFFDNNGNVLSGGKIYSYVAGTTTPTPTYTTVNGDVAHTNPIILDSAGRVPGGQIWLTIDQYKFIVTTSADVQLVSLDYIGVASSGGIVTANIADGAVTNPKLATDAVSTDKILDDAITTDKIIDESITLAKMTSDSVGTDQIIDENVTTAKLADAAVTDAKLAAGAAISNIGPAGVALTNMANDSVDTDQLVDGCVTVDKLDPSAQVTTSSVLAATALAAIGSVGTYAFLTDASSAPGTTTNPGSTQAGSSLRYAGISGISGSGIWDVSYTVGLGYGVGYTTSTPTGTWQAMGVCKNSGSNDRSATLWLRIV